HQVLVDAAGGQRQPPPGRHVVQLGLEVTDLDEHDVRAARVQAELGEVALQVIGLAHSGEDDVQATGAQHHLGLGIAVAMPNGVHDAGDLDGAGVPVVDGGPTGHGHGG